MPSHEPPPTAAATPDPSAVAAGGRGGGGGSSNSSGGRLPLVPVSPLSQALHARRALLHAAERRRAIALAELHQQQQQQQSKQSDDLQRLRRRVEDVEMAAAAVAEVTSAIADANTATPPQPQLHHPHTVPPPLLPTLDALLLAPPERIAAAIARIDAALWAAAVAPPRATAAAAAAASGARTSAATAPDARAALLGFDPAAWDRAAAAATEINGGSGLAAGPPSASNAVADPFDAVDAARSLGVGCMLDFASYLERVVLVSVLEAAEHVATVAITPSGSHPAAATVASTAAATTTAWVAIAHVLLYCFRDLNGAAAVVAGLLDPRVSRLGAAWLRVGQRTRDVLRDLADLLGAARVVARPGRNTGGGPPAAAVGALAVAAPTVSAAESASAAAGAMHGARAAADLLAEILAHHFRRGRMAAVPWVEPLVLELDRLRGLYSMSTLRPVGSGGEGRADGGAGSGAVLMAEAGQRAADELLELAALSVGVGSGERLAAERLGAVGAGGATSAVPHSPPRQHAAAHAQLPPHSTVVAGKEHATPPPWERPVSVHYADLTELLAARPTLADMKAMHFVLARTYHGDDGALWALSLTLQPASEAERRELLYLQPPPPPPPQASLPADGQRRVEEPLVGDDEDDGFGISGDDDGDENDDDDEGMPALTRDLARALLAAGSGGSAPADARFVPSGPALSSRPSTAETSSPSSRSNYSRTPDNASDDESGSSHGDAGETRRLLAELDGLPAARSVGPPAGDVSAAAGGAMPSLPPLSPPSLPHPADPPLPPQLSQAPPEGGGGGGEGSDSGAGVAADGTAAPVQRASAERLESGAGGAGGAGHAEVGEVDELLDMSADDYL